MRQFTVHLVCVLWSTLSFSQIHKEPYLLVSDSLWTKEIFQFPIHFAKDIDYMGFEDARFPPHWAKQNHAQHWSYVFAWGINAPKSPSKRELQEKLTSYFDGLMNLVNKDKSITVPKTRVELTSTQDFAYNDKVTFYDSFHSKTVRILNLLRDIHACAQQEKHFVVFRFSPKAFDAIIWNDLKAVQLRDDCCTVSL